MTKSLPAEAAAASVPVLTHPTVGNPSTARLAFLNVASGVGLRAIPRIPDAVKRLILGRRTVTIDGNTLDTTLQLMLASLHMSRVKSGLVASNDVHAARAQLRKLAAVMDSGVSVGVRDLVIRTGGQERSDRGGTGGPAADMRARHYIPVNTIPAGPVDSSRERSSAPLLVFYHGGGFVVGDLETHDAPCRLLCRDAGVQVLSVDYRLAPEHPAPAGIEDCYAAYRWAREHAEELGANPDRVAVGGDSAGGNLAAVVSQLALADGVRLPDLQLLLYPVTNFDSDTRSKTLFADGYFLTKADMDWFRANYLTGSSIGRADPRVSPLLADDLSGLPPALVVTDGFDPLRDEGTQYAEALAAAGVDTDHRHYGSLIHGFANFFPLGGGSATAMAEIASALRAHLSRT
jgi:acetyl esterase